MIQQGEFDVIYPANHTTFQDKLINYVNEYNEQKAVETLQTLTMDYLADSMESKNYIRYMYIQLCTSLLNNLLLKGIDKKHLKCSPYELYQNLQKSENLHSLQDYVISLISDSIAIISEQKNRSHSDIIGKTIDYIENNYIKDLSQDEIAGNVYLNL